MPLTPVPTASDWSAVIAEAAKTMFNGELCAIIPARPGGDYDPETDTYPPSAPEVVLIDWRPARAQHLAMPLESSDGSGWNTKRRFRFQSELRADDPIIPKGAVVRFRGGNDPTLAQFAFQVTSAVNSSHAALRTIETVTEGGVAAPTDGLSAQEAIDKLGAALVAAGLPSSLLAGAVTEGGVA